MTFPSNSARIGLYSVFYHVSADDLSGPYVPPGANIDAKNVETVYLAYVRRLSSHFDVELTLGYPPLRQKTVWARDRPPWASVPYNGQVIATARWLAPTLLFEYVFFDENSKLRPYIGAGVNYTTFYDRNSTAEGNAASGGPTKLSLTSSVGPTGTVGLAYNIAHNWNLYGSYSISQVRTKLNADTAGGDPHHAHQLWTAGTDRVRGLFLLGSRERPCHESLESHSTWSVRNTRPCSCRRLWRRRRRNWAAAPRSCKKLAAEVSEWPDRSAHAFRMWSSGPSARIWLIRTPPPDHVVTIVGAEPSRLAARILQTANSAAFNSIGQAA